MIQILYSKLNTLKQKVIIIIIHNHQAHHNHEIFFNNQLFMNSNYKFIGFETMMFNSFMNKLVNLIMIVNSDHLK